MSCLLGYQHERKKMLQAAQTLHLPNRVLCHAGAERLKGKFAPPSLAGSWLSALTEAERASTLDLSLFSDGRACALLYTLHRSTMLFDPSTAGDLKPWLIRTLEPVSVAARPAFFSRTHTDMSLVCLPDATRSPVRSRSTSSRSSSTTRRRPSSEKS